MSTTSSFLLTLVVDVVSWLRSKPVSFFPAAVPAAAARFFEEASPPAPDLLALKSASLATSFGFTPLSLPRSPWPPAFALEPLPLPAPSSSLSESPSSSPLVSWSYISFGMMFDSDSTFRPLFVDFFVCCLPVALVDALLDALVAALVEEEGEVVEGGTADLERGAFADIPADNSPSSDESDPYPARPSII